MCTWEVDKYFKIVLLHDTYWKWLHTLLFYLSSDPLFWSGCGLTISLLCTLIFPVTSHTQISARLFFQAHLISSVYSNHSPSVLLTDSSIHEFLYELTTSNYLALNNFLLILSHSCLICALLILFIKLLLPPEKKPHSVRSVQMRSMYMRHIRISFMLLYLFFLV